MKTNLVIILMISFLATFAEAQNGTPQETTPAIVAIPTQKVSAKKGKVSVTFDDELVKGGTMLPEGDLISNRMENRFKRFIKVRKDFIQDVENTKDEFGHK